MLNIAVFAPMPIARVSTATAAKPGFFSSWRQAKRIWILDFGFWILDSQAQWTTKLEPLIGVTGHRIDSRSASDKEQEPRMDPARRRRNRGRTTDGHG